MGAGVQPGGALSGRRARRRAARPMSEINVTPMVDVMLVLLIIFMVAAPLLSVGIDVPPPDLPKVELPKTEAGPISPDKEPLYISVNPEGKIFLQTTEIGFDQLVPKLTAIRDAGNEGAVQIHGDKSTQYENVAKVIARVSQAGFQVRLVTDPVN
jgi:biopolymer transport protein TolR